MTQSNHFPPELLTQSADAKVTYFKDKVIAHPILVEVYQKIRAVIDEPGGVSLVFAFGPTGVGKSTLCRRLVQKINEQKLPELEQNPGMMPIIRMEAPAPESGSFNWKDFYHRGLAACYEPLIEQKLNPVARNPRGHQSLVRAQASSAELCRAFESCLKERRPEAFIIDEATHLGKVHSGRRQLDQMDKLKSLANLTQTVLILVGTYDLLHLTNLNGQLSRRSVDIEFRRYRFDDQDDRHNFKGVLQTFARYLPLPVTPDFVADEHYFYERSLGCTGILKEWLVRSLADALSYDAATIDRACLDRNAHSDFKLLQNVREMKAGEGLLTEREERMAEIRAALGITPSSSHSPATNIDPDKTRQYPERVGIRLPGRDPVGGES
jgi:hypothetical protein